MRAARWAMIMLVTGVLTVACHQPSTPSSPVLRWSAIPDRAAQSVRAQHLPLMDAVCSVVVVRSADAARSVRDLQGRSFTFGDRDSTSGHVMARHFLSAQGIDPEKFFSRVGYSGGQDKTLQAVAAGEVDAGCLNASIAYEALASGGPYQGRLRMLWESPAYPDYVWTARRDLPVELRQRLIDAFLDLDISTAGSQLVLASEFARGFLPAFAGDFQLVAGVLERAGNL